MDNHICSPRDLFHATYRVANDRSNNPEHLQHWKDCVDAGGSMHVSVNFIFDVDALHKKQYVACTAFEYMLRTWDLPKLAFALQVLGVQSNIELNHLTKTTRAFSNLYKQDTGLYCDVANEMKRWGKHMESIKTLHWHLPWGKTSIFAWEALWGQLYDPAHPDFMANIRCLQSHLPLMDQSALPRFKEMVDYDTKMTKGQSTSGTLVALLGFDANAQQHPAHQQIVNSLPEQRRALYEKILLHNALSEVQTTEFIKRKM